MNGKSQPKGITHWSLSTGDHSTLNFETLWEETKEYVDVMNLIHIHITNLFHLYKYFN